MVILLNFPVNKLENFMRYIQLLFIITLLNAVQIVVDPYLQDGLPASMTIMWETDSGSESLVEYGESNTLGMSANGTSVIGLGISRIHTVVLSGLSPATRYYYKTITSTAESDVYDFITPPAEHQNFTFVAMSDMQKDFGNYDKFDEVVHEGIMTYMANNYSGDIVADLNFVLIPGDLVDNGNDYSTWEDHFFDPAAPLFAHVPVYPVLGNHENNTAYYFKYFHLPQNGSVGYEEHWWTKDFSNVRIIGMDSNWDYQLDVQLDWLEALLNQTCTDNSIDFVFAELHHPHKSELWLAGETAFTGEVIERMENFTTACGKPSIHFFGHTHGYSRGQSVDHRHLWVDVATAGGNVDYWGEYAQNDYEEYTVTQSEWGFVVLDIETGNDPQFTMRRISRGNENLFRDNEIRDVITIRRNNNSPETPITLSPGNSQVDPTAVTLQALEFDDMDGDEHGFSHWQISADCVDFSNPDYDKYESHENWYYEEDTQAGNSLTQETFHNLDPESDFCWRVRYRDKGLSWSEWSQPSPFSTGDSPLSANLLNNPGAENGTLGWTVDTGIFESLTSGECDGVAPHSGNYYFAVGGLCTESAYAEVHQDVYLFDYAVCIDDGGIQVHYGGFLSNWGGQDHPEFMLEFRDSTGSMIDETEILDTYNSTWTEFNSVIDIPADTRIVRFIKMGTRYAGTDNDSYFDDMYLRIYDGCMDEVLAGDLDANDLVNVLDIIIMVNLVLGGEATEYQVAAGDLNGDGLINVVDIIQVVNIILNAI